MRVLSSLLLLTFGVFAHDVEVNNKCSYTSQKNIFTCAGLEYVNPNAIANFLTEGTHLFIIRHTKNTIEIPSNSFESHNFKNIVSFDIVDNSDLEISANGYRGLDGLRYMKITGNRWNTVKSKSFATLKNLELLNLSGNNITQLEPNSLDGLNGLSTIDLSSNKIRVIPNKVFVDMTRLGSLYLERNEIEGIQDDAFEGLSDLKLLDLTKNSLSVLSAVTFNKLVNLEGLYLGFNKIERISVNLNLPHLEFLELKHNSLKSVSEFAFENLVQLRLLDLANNSLRNIDEKPFVKLTHLRHLNLIGNGADKAKFENVATKVLVLV